MVLLPLLLPAQKVGHFHYPNLIDSLQEARQAIPIKAVAAIEQAHRALLRQASGEAGHHLAAQRAMSQHEMQTRGRKL